MKVYIKPKLDVAIRVAVIPREGVERPEIRLLQMTNKSSEVIPREGVERWGYGLAYQLVTRRDPERGS